MLIIHFSLLCICFVLFHTFLE